MIRNEPNKIIQPSFNYIDGFCKPKKIKILLSPSLNDKVDIEFIKQGNVFHFKLINNIPETFNEFAAHLEELFDNNTILDENYTFSFLSQSLQKFELTPKDDTVKGSLRSFIENRKEDYNGSFLRFVQPFSSNPKIGSISESNNLRTDQKVLYGFGIISIQIDRNLFDIFRVSIGKQNYCLIDSKQLIDLDLFDKICSAIFYAYSFLFGYSAGEESFILSSANSEFETINGAIFISKPSSLEHKFCVFDSMEIQSLKLSSSFYQFPKNTFSALCEKIYSDEKYFRLINLIHEANLNKYSYSSCVLFSVALETISNIMNDQTSSPPISPERFEKSNIFNELCVDVERNQYLNKPEKQFIISKKLITLNKPTNIDRISSLFRFQTFRLPSQFEIALKYRDKYLHGSSPKNTNNIPEEYENHKRKFELQFLVNVLTLKAVGYSGYIRNTCAFMEYFSQLEKGVKRANIETSTSFYYKI
jgi:hypothetical protein